MKIICVVGECYSGKSFLIEKLTNIFQATVIHLGDIFRKKNYNSICVDEHIVATTLIDFCNNTPVEKNVIIDNAFKNVKQAEAVLSSIGKEIGISIIWVTNKRSEVDLSSRNRIDDKNIESKLKLWKENEKDLREFLEKNNYKIQDVYNTDNGFLFC